MLTATPTPIPAALDKVRIEDGTSIGRSYSAAGHAQTIPGLGARRRQLKTRSFQPYITATSSALGAGDAAAASLASSEHLPVLESCTLSKVNLQKCTREEVMEYFQNTWQLTDTLFSAFKNDSVFYMVPDALRRPLIFYFGHPAALYINKMHQAGLVDHVDPFFQKLFETGVDEMSWDDMDVMQDEDFHWPDVPQVMEFRNNVKKVVEALISKMPHPRDVPVTMESPMWALFLAFEHERIHLETSSVLIRQLPIDVLEEPLGWRTAPSFASEPSSAPSNAVVEVAEGTVILGKPTNYPSFGWDNEYGKRAVTVPSFHAAKFLTTNAEFLPFIVSGGYTDRQWWVSPSGDDEGWRWNRYRNATHPSFWVATSHADMLKYHGGKKELPYQKDDGHPGAGTDNTWKLRVEFTIIPMPWDWPVEVNYLEAAAFMRWKGAQDALAGNAGVVYRFPTEAEYHMVRGDPAAYEGATVGAGRKAAGDGFGDGKLGAAGNGKTFTSTTITTTDANIDESGKVDVIMQPAAPGNVNWRWHSSSPVDLYGASSTGFHDSHGNTWQWVEDHFAPLPGFEIHYLYDDFSAPCFDGWHTLIMGGSWVSTGDQASSFARYHFRRHFFQHMGFRYVRLGPAAAAQEPFAGSATVTNLWEGMSTVSKDITNGYARPAERLPHAPELVAADNAMAYSVNLAQLASKAYETHVLSTTSAAGSASSTSSTTAAATTTSSATVLHLGCGIGAGTFELCRLFGKVVGVDNREPAIRHARVFQHHGQFEYERVREGVLTDTALVRVPAGIERGRAVFKVGDATAISEEILAQGPFDVVILDSILTRVRQPLDVLSKLGDYVRPGGLLIVTSNNDWSPAFTPRNSWLGGFKMNGEDMPTLHMLKYTLKRKFTALESCDLARLTRSHSRRFVLDVMEASVWRKIE